MALRAIGRNEVVTCAWLLAVLVCVLVGEDRSPAVESRSGDDADRKARTLTNGVPMYEVSIAGKAKWMIVDTGSNMSALLSLSDDAKWIGGTVETVKAGTPGGVMTAEQIRGVGVSVENMPRRQINLFLLSVNYPSMHMDSPVEGLLGMDYFGHDALSFNLAKGLVSIEADARELPNATRVELRRSRGLVFIPVNCGLPQSQFAIIDTGMSGTLSLEPRVCQNLERVGLAVPLPAGKVVSLAGTSSRKQYILKLCQVAGYEFKNIPISEGPVPMIGTDLLAEFEFVLDLKQDYALFRKSGDLKQNWDLVPGASGFHVSFPDPTEKKCTVHSVDDKSAGHEAGFKAGDVVISVDGDAVAGIGIRNVTRRFRQAGKTLRVEIERDGRRGVLDLKLRWPLKYPPDWPAERAIQQAPLLPE